MDAEIISALIGGVSGALIARVTSVFDKSKIFFEKKFEALSEMHNLVREILPEWPMQMDMDWHEACEHLAHGAGITEKKLSGFRKKFSGALTDKELVFLDRAVELARATNFSVLKDSPQSPDFTISNESMDMANKMWTEISVLEQEIRSSVLNQARVFPNFFKLWCKKIKLWRESKTQSNGFKKKR